MSEQADNVHMLYQPNVRAMREHLERLFHTAQRDYPGGLVEIAWSDPTGAVNSANSFPITPEGLDKAAAEAEKRNLGKRNVYVGVNPRIPGTAPFGRAKADEVERAYYQFADVDRPEGIEKLRGTLPLNYTMAVTTGRIPGPRVHPYWELEEPILNMDAWRAQQIALADYFESDRVIDASRVMRLAGSVSYPPTKKAGAGYQVEPVTLRTIYEDDERRQPIASEDLFHAYPWSKPHAEASEGPQPDPGSSDRFDTGRKDPRDYIRNINAGFNLHNNARDLVAHLVNTGHRDWLIREFLDRLLRPVSDGGTLGQVEGLIQSARQKYAAPDPPPEEDFNAPPPEAEPWPAEPVPVLNPHARGPRQWLVPYRMMRHHITMTTAAPGVGKSTLAIEEAVSMASGIDFLGFGITKPLRVAIINNEETKDELERRIEATCQHFDVPFEAIAGRLFLYSGIDQPKLVLARHDRRNGIIIATPGLIQLRLLIEKQALDAVVLDPLVQLHYAEESSNEQMSKILQDIREQSGNAAIHIIHHNRKPVAGNSHQAGDMYSARGASSLAGDAHFFFTLTDMDETDGEQMNIPDHDRSNFLRLDDAKHKMAPAKNATWFERHGEMMPYNLIGEEIGILIPHDRSEIDNSNISTYTATNILNRIDEAWTNGYPYSQWPRATDRYVVTKLMVHEFNVTRTTAKSLLKSWLENKIVESQECSSHKNLNGLRVLKWPG